MKLSVDIDGVLCNNTYGHPERAVPNRAAIKQLRKWVHEGVVSRVIVASARPWGLYSLTKMQLDQWDVPYDELILGVPEADHYINDRSFQTVEQLFLQMEFAADGRFEPELSAVQKEMARYVDKVVDDENKPGLSSAGNDTNISCGEPAVEDNYWAKEEKAKDA